MLCTNMCSCRTAHMTGLGTHPDNAQHAWWCTTHLNGKTSQNGWQSDLHAVCKLRHKNVMHCKAELSMPYLSKITGGRRSTKTFDSTASCAQSQSIMNALTVEGMTQRQAAAMLLVVGFIPCYITGLHRALLALQCCLQATANLCRHLRGTTSLS